MSAASTNDERSSDALHMQDDGANGMLSVPPRQEEVRSAATNPIPEGRERSSLGLGLVPEGQECPTCLRRVPKKKKPTSPVTKPFSFRIPIDDHETFKEMLEAAARSDGQYEKSHWQYWTILRGLVRTLRGDGA